MVLELHMLGGGGGSSVYVFLAECDPGGGRGVPPRSFWTAVITAFTPKTSAKTILQKVKAKKKHALSRGIAETWHKPHRVHMHRPHLRLDAQTTLGTRRQSTRNSIASFSATHGGALRTCA